MNTEHFVLCIFPLVLFVIMLIQVKFAAKSTFHEDFLSLQNTKILQGIAAVCIVFHHLSQYITEYGAVWKGPITLFSSMGIFFTTIFFFCSGYGLVTSYNKKPDYLKSFFKKRMPSVLIPFMMSNIIYLIFVGLYFRNVNSVLEGIANFFGLVLINTNTWFLVEIIILYLAFYFIFRFVKKPKNAIAVMAGFIVIMITASLLLGHDSSDGGGHWFMGEWWYNTTIFFLVGMLTAQYYDKILNFMKKHYKWLLPVSVLLFLITFVGEEIIISIFGYYREWEGHPGYGAKAVTLLAQTVVCFFWLLMLLLICLKVQFKNRLLILLSKISLELYIMHDIFKVHFTISRYRREDWVVFFWVLVMSLAAAIVLHLIDRFIIDFVTDRKKEDEKEVLTLEQKIKRKKQKKNKIIIITCSVIVIVTVSILATKELYQIFVLPQKYYEEEAALLADADIGDEIMFGTYDLEGTSFGKDRVVWTVIDKKDGQVLLVSKYILDSKEYHNSYVEITWEECNLRKLLNEDFYEMAFSDYEKALICDVTSDKIFLLSAEEVETYFTKEERCVTAAPYLGDGEVNVDAMNGVDYNQRDFNSWWWLRNPGETGKQAAIVNSNGEIDLDGKHVTTASGGVRPAMWVQCE